MNVILVNGSPKKNGNTAQLLKLAAAQLEAAGIGVEIMNVGGLHLHGCIACNYCANSPENMCVFRDDPVNAFSGKLREADGIVLAAPTYYAGIPGAMKCFLDRVFYSGMGRFRHKIGTSLAVLRRSGGVGVFQQLNNYLNLAEMVPAPSQYWMAVHGLEPGEVLGDEEGLQTLRKNMDSFIWLLKLVNENRQSYPPPPNEPRVMTNFMR